MMYFWARQRATLTADPAQCVENPPPTPRVYSDQKHWEIKNPDDEPFRGILASAGQIILEWPGLPQTDLIHTDIFLRGNTIETSSVYLMLAHRRKGLRKGALKRLKGSSLLEQYPGLGLDHWPLDIRMTGYADETPLASSDQLVFFDWDQFKIQIAGRGKSNENAPLSIRVTRHDDGSSQTGTLSSFIRKGEGRWILVPAHLFTPPVPDGDDFDSDTDDTDTDDESEVLRAASATPSNLDSDSNSTSNDSLHGSHPENLVSTTSSPTVFQTDASQPSVGDHPFISTELDYALIPLPRTAQFDEQLQLVSSDAIMSIDVGHHQISLTTRSGGLMLGTLVGRPTQMRLPYGKSFSKLYPVNLFRVICNGDSGSTVVDVHTRKIYGFVAASSADGKIAYIVRAEEVFEDAKTRLSILPDPPQNTGDLLAGHGAARYHRSIDEDGIFKDRIDHPSPPDLPLNPLGLPFFWKAIAPPPKPPVGEGCQPAGVKSGSLEYLVLLCIQEKIKEDPDDDDLATIIEFTRELDAIVESGRGVDTIYVSRCIKLAKKASDIDLGLSVASSSSRSRSSAVSSRSGWSSSSRSSMGSTEIDSSRSATQFELRTATEPPVQRSVLVRHRTGNRSFIMRRIAVESGFHSRPDESIQVDLTLGHQTINCWLVVSDDLWCDVVLCAQVAAQFEDYKPKDRMLEFIRHTTNTSMDYSFLGSTSTPSTGRRLPLGDDDENEAEEEYYRTILWGVGELKKSERKKPEKSIEDSLGD